AHYLLSKQTSLAAIHRVYSHPQALGQCTQWLKQHLPNAEHVACLSTTDAAQKSAKDLNGAAIAGALAADLFALKILRENIQDIKKNQTRFFVLHAKAAPGKNNLAHALILTPQTQDEGLSKILNVIEKNRASLRAVYPISQRE